MFICQCGCNKEIPYVKWHETHPPRFIKGHNTPRGEHLYARHSTCRIPSGGVPCGCGCKGMVTEYKSPGHARYQRSQDGKFYLHGHNPAKHGKESHKWKGGRYKNHSGYVLVYMPDHPKVNQDGYILEHRYIWEQSNGQLKSNEVVHHINGIRDDNRIENLVAITKSGHSKHHIAQHDGFKKTKDQYRAAGKLGAKARWA